jgi:hypothetical protein
MKDGAKVLELFSTYESILPEDLKYGPVIGYERPVIGHDISELIVNPFKLIHNNALYLFE